MLVFDTYKLWLNTLAKVQVVVCLPVLQNTFTVIQAYEN